MKLASKKHLPAAACFALCLIAGQTSIAGQAEVKAPVEMEKEVKLETPPESPWDLTIRPYGWIAGLDGTTGIAGYTAETDVDFKKILENLEMVAMMQVDVRYDRWLLLLDGQYLKLGADTNPQGGILSAASLEIEQIMLEAALGYRVLQGEDGYLDVFLGARYMSVEGGISLAVDSAGVEDLSQDVSREIISRIGGDIRDRAAPALSAAQSALEERIFEVRGAARDKIVEEAKDRIRERLEDIIGRPDISREVALRGPVRDAIRDLIDAQIAERQAAVAEAKAEVQAEIQAAKARASARARRAVTKAERKLASELESAIKRAIPEQVSGKQDWVDPIIGLRGRWNFADPFYVTGRADIGGFGVGSDLTWQVYAAVGCQVTRCAHMELGYRHLAVDYEGGGFTYDVAMSGAVVALGIEF